MIAGIRGTLSRVSGDHVVILCGGFYVRVVVPLSTLQVLPTIGETVELQTHLYFREDVIALYGFQTADELALFELLLTVQGVGPRLALSLLSVFAPIELRQVLGRGEERRLLKVPGIGRRMAARLILELRDRIGRIVTDAEEAAIGVDDQLVTALMTWGYRRADAERALQVAQIAAIPDDGARLAAAAAFLVQQAEG
ncbi:MAG: Holliday junction branch migration protein RuvA [Chloroflexi bacterium]|nr:Holliday junction branch migration protein RuvA [Chloroflexota bacterium]